MTFTFRCFQCGAQCAACRIHVTITTAKGISIRRHLCSPACVRQWFGQPPS